MYCNGFIEIAHFENVNKESCFLVILSLKTLEIREPFSIRSSKSGDDEKMLGLRSTYSFEHLDFHWQFSIPAASIWSE